MSLWWVAKNDLDDTQLECIEDLPLRESHLVLGPPGCGKTNILLRRAQFVRTQGMPNVMVLTFTRALTEFIKTGCYNAQGQEIFPRSLVSTLERWIRSLYKQHNVEPPPKNDNLAVWKSTLAKEALTFAEMSRIPKYDALFVDEAQDLNNEELSLLQLWSPTLYFVGDEHQKIYEHSVGLGNIQEIIPQSNIHALKFHYRMAPELCEIADKIMIPDGGIPLTKTSHYQGPKPGRIGTHGPLSKEQQVAAAAERLVDQSRAYADLISRGDRLGIIVPRQADREFVLDLLDEHPFLAGMAQIIRARTGELDDHDYDPTFDPSKPILIVTEQGSKGLEFRAAHWLFCNDLEWFRKVEMYYTVVTRAKTSLDFYFDKTIPGIIAGAYAPQGSSIW
jgi:hypothetical protein